MVINIGSGTETEVRDLMRLVLQVTGSKAEVMNNPRTDPGVSRMRADIRLAKEKLGYQPRISLEDGLRLTIERDLRFKRDATRPLRI
jgi:nucleoside-diphosphate-sugar epimerase